jgi:hypothetical protein
VNHAIRHLAARVRALSRWRAPGQCAHRRPAVAAEQPAARLAAPPPPPTPTPYEPYEELTDIITAIVRPYVLTSERLREAPDE